MHQYVAITWKTWKTFKENKRRKKNLKKKSETILSEKLIKSTQAVLRYIICMIVVGDRLQLLLLILREFKLFN